MTLEKYQRDMANFILHRSSEIALHETCKRYGEDELTARLSIYRNNTFHSLVEATKDLYPNVMELLGLDVFSAIAKSFVHAHPPKQAAMVDFGQDFPAFIDTLDLVQQYSYLPDVARLDLLYHQSYHAHDDEPADDSVYANIDVASLAQAKIRPIDSVRLLSSQYAIFTIWQLNQKIINHEVEAEKPQNVLIIRPNTEVLLYEIDEGNTIFLSSLINQLTLGEALEKASENASAFNPTEAITFLIQSGFAATITGDHL